MAEAVVSIIFVKKLVTAACDRMIYLILKPLIALMISLLL